MNVFHNIAFPLEVQNVPVEEIKQRVYDVADLFGLSNLLTRKIKELSIGQAQKVLLAKAMVKKPSLYLFDEPFSNLDNAVSVNALGVMEINRVSTNKLYVPTGDEFILNGGTA